MDGEVPHQLKVYESTRRHDLTAHGAAGRRDLYGRKFESTPLQQRVNKLWFLLR